MPGVATTAAMPDRDPVLDALEAAYQLDDIAEMRRHYMAAVWRIFRGDLHEAVQLRTKLARYDDRLNHAWRTEIGYRVA
jgi:dihydroorotase-like cyclic amidohydrolase